MGRTNSNLLSWQHHAQKTLPTQQQQPLVQLQVITKVQPGPPPAAHIPFLIPDLLQYDLNSCHLMLRNTIPVMPASHCSSS
ncbi:uncharacterized [Lates japonicus]